MAGKSQHQQQDRVLQVSYLIPSYQKALPHALLHECPDDHRLRKIEATCSCKIGWGRNLPARLAERYSLLQIQLDPKRGNYLGALNLLRQYFLGNAALIPFQRTLLRPNGSQVTKKFPTSLDDCQLLMPRCDRFGRVVVDLAVAVAAVADDRAAAAELRSEAGSRLADRLIISGLRCLAMHAAFLEYEAAAASLQSAAANDALLATAEAEAALAAAAAAEAELAHAAEMVAQCEVSRACVCTLVEAAEATRLLEQLDEGRQHHRSSMSPSRRRIDFRLSPPPPLPLAQQPHAQSATPPRQANNHHRPANRGRDRRQQPRQHSPPRQNRRSPHDESCATTLADVEAITFAESEYVDKPAARGAAKKAPSAAVAAAAAAAASATTRRLPESLLLCGLQPSAASALSALDRSDRRLKTVERRTGCRLELREARGSATSQQVSYALQVRPLRPDARPRGCVNMLRSLLHGIDPDSRFCVVGASDSAAAAADATATVAERPLKSWNRSKSAGAANPRHDVAGQVHRTSHRSRHQLSQQRLRRGPLSPAPPSSVSPARVRSAAVVDCAGRLLRLAVVDCVLGASATAAAAASSDVVVRRLELRREAVLGDALVCVLRSLTATEADVALLSEAMDGGGVADAETEEFGILRDAVQRTLIACAVERRVRGYFGTFACLPEAVMTAPDSAAAASSSVATSVRRRLARLTLACWERLCTEALCCSGAEVGIGLMLEAATAVAATEAVAGLLATARLTLTSTTLTTSSWAADKDVESIDDVINGRVCGSNSCHHPQRQQRGQHRRHRRTPSQLRRLLSVLAVKRLLADELETAVVSRATLAAALTHLAVELVSEQVWNACLKTRLMLRPRLRAA